MDPAEGHWRIINWFLGSILLSPRLRAAFAKIEDHGDSPRRTL
jgi:hypothetical protein